MLIYDRISANKRETWLLMLAFFVVIGGCRRRFGIAFGMPVGYSPVIIVFVLGFSGVFSYFGASSVALSVSGAREVTGDEEPELYASSRT